MVSDLRVLMLSNAGPASTTFIKQDVLALNDKVEIKYVYFTDVNQHIISGVDTEYVEYNLSSLKRRLLWRLEKNDILIDHSDKRFCKQLNEVIRSYDPHLIHFQFGYDSIKLFDNFSGTDIPIIVQFRGYDASGKLLQKTYVNKLKRILSQPYVYSVFVCEFLKSNIEKNGIQCYNSEVLYTGIDTELFECTKREKEQGLTRFIQVSSFNEKKGHHITLKAFSVFKQRYPEKDFKLTIVGEGYLKNKVEEYINFLGLSNEVELLGKKSSAEVVELLDCHDIYVQHSITTPEVGQEGIPNSIIEAMAMTMPILSSIHAGIPEVVEHGTNGLLVEERNIEQYVDAINDIYDWEPLDINRVLVKQKFSLKGHVERLIQIYEQVCLKR